MTPEQEALGNELTNLQRLTVLGVVSGKSQRQAYYDAGGSAKNDASADTVVSGMLSNPKVRAFYDSLMVETTGKAIMSREQALERLTLMGTTHITDILDFETVDVSTINKNGEAEIKQETIWRMKDSAELSKRAGAAIKSITMTKQGPKIEMYDAKAAMELIGKWQGWEAAQKVVHGGDPANPVVNTTLDAAAYKKLRKDMLGDDDC